MTVREWWARYQHRHWTWAWVQSAVSAGRWQDQSLNGSTEERP